MSHHENILAQLANLKKWHEEHCGDEDSNQTLSRMEDQAKLYQMLGFSPSFINEIEISQTNNSSTPPLLQGNDAALNNSSPKQHERKSCPEEPVDALTIVNNLSEANRPEEKRVVVAKKPFLKRGEGLSNRFKVHPDRYKLHNLPKYKYAAGTGTGTRGKGNAASEEGINHSENEQINGNLAEPPKQETPFKYDLERTRKSCLKLDSVSQFEELRQKMNQFCTEFIKDDSGDMDETRQPPVPEDNAKRMLDFSRKSPRVTFSSEVMSIPFEQYFHPPQGTEKEAKEDDSSSEEGESRDGEDEEPETVCESLRCDFGHDAIFQKHAVISTPLEVLKENHKLVEDSCLGKSPRTMLVEKGSQLREKLKELEEETQNFREQNRYLQKMRQAIELEKVQVAQTQTELEKAFREQRLKLELDYEKLKESLQEDRAKIEQRSLVPNKKFKEETKALTEKIDELEKEIKNREVKHGASQTRLRCHIRSLEKENREHLSTIETLKKENKRLETENARLQRQKNNKMLTEINKNIAKLSVNNPSREEEKDKVPVKKPEGSKAQTKRVVPEKPSRKHAPVIIPDKSASISTEEESEAESCSEDPPKGQSNYFPTVTQSTVQTVRPVSESYADKENQNRKQLRMGLNETMGGFKKETVNEDGSKDVVYPNGNLKKVSADGLVVKVLYFNKDIKETNINEGTVKYYYAETNTWHTSYLDGLEVLEFPSGQTEHRHKNGKVEIFFPNGIVRRTNPKDNEVLEEWQYPDGTTVLETRSKEKIIKMPNGQREIHTADHKRREYPDGTVKIVYADGRTETRYGNGRIRVKDKEGNLISDSQNSL